MTKLRILGWLYAGLGAIGLVAGTVLCLALLLQNDPRGLPAFQFIMPLFLMIALVTLLPGLIGGIGLLRGKSWARIPIIIASLPLLLAFPVGTALAAFALWVLYEDDKRTTLSPQPATNSAPPTSPSPFAAAAQRELINAGGILLIAAGVGSGFILAIGIGFRVNRQQAPAIIDDYFYVAAVVFVLTVATAIALWQARTNKGSPAARVLFALVDRPRIARQQKDVEDAHRRHLAELAADPVRRKYLARIERGEPWSNEQIAYNEDRAQLATCQHLAPIERAMREAFLDVRLISAAAVRAPCVIDQAELARRFAPLEPVRYVEYMSGERSALDPLHATLTCEACKSAIMVLHQGEATLQTPLFPPPA